MFLKQDFILSFFNTNYKIPKLISYVGDQEKWFSVAFV